MFKKYCVQSAYMTDLLNVEAAVIVAAVAALFLKF